MIKILANYTNYSGATVAHINLCNLFNDNGVACELYGPHEWHLSQCKGNLISEYIPDATDTIIVHAKILQERPPCKKLIYTHHECKPNISKYNLHLYDNIHFITETQSSIYNLSNPQFVIQNVMDNLNYGHKPKIPTAGIIGRIVELKQTHISIQRAVSDGFSQIILFGCITDIFYYNKFVLPLVLKHKIQVRGWCEDKQQMYNSVTDVYHSSLEEVKCYVIGECKLTNTKIHLLPGMLYNDEDYSVTNNDIFKIWKNKLNLV